MNTALREVRRFEAGMEARAAGRAADIGRHAVLALYDELELAPKPGLVSFVDSGSHRDMDARSFMRSLFALRRAFPALAALGAAFAPFEALQEEGLAAEAQMMRATGGVNTHRGAIYTLGLLCAAAGRRRAQGRALTESGLRGSLRQAWGPALAARADGGRPSKGAHAARAHGLRSVGHEAADAFPALFECVWPALQGALAQGLSWRHARLQALYAAMAVVDDTNLVHRGGIQALREVQAQARAFLTAGGMFQRDALAQCWALHRKLVARQLSPGGCADLLAAACWLQRVLDGVPRP